VDKPVPSILVILGPFSFKIRTSVGSVLQKRPALASYRIKKTIMKIEEENQLEEDEH
jgi:hypothetical protein